MDANVGREAAMRKDETELIHQAIEQLIAQKKTEREERVDIADVDDEEDERLLSKLLSQLESLKKDNTTEQQPEANETDVGSYSHSKEVGNEEIMKELRQVRRQNRVTHFLISVMIMLTAAWQLSEVSLLLKVKNKVSHPFRSVGSMITGAQDAFKHFDGHEHDSRKKDHSPIELPVVPVPALKVPELPELPGLD